MGKFFDELAADVEYAAEVQDGGRGELIPSRSGIGGDEVSVALAGMLRDVHARANAYRMAEAIATEAVACEEFVSEYGHLPRTERGVASFVAGVRRAVAERGGALEQGEELGGDVIAQLLAAADDEDDEGAGAGRAARVEEPRRTRGGDAR